VGGPRCRRRCGAVWRTRRGGWLCRQGGGVPRWPRATRAAAGAARRGVRRCHRARRRRPGAVACRRGPSVGKKRQSVFGGRPHPPPPRGHDRAPHGAAPPPRGALPPARGGRRGAVRPRPHGGGQTRCAAARSGRAAAERPPHPTQRRGGGGVAWPNRLRPAGGAAGARRRCRRRGRAPVRVPPFPPAPPRPRAPAPAAAPPTARPPPWLGPLAAWPSSRATGASGAAARPRGGGDASPRLAHAVAARLLRTAAQWPAEPGAPARRASTSTRGGRLTVAPRAWAACPLWWAPGDLVWVAALQRGISCGRRTPRRAAIPFGVFASRFFCFSRRISPWGPCLAG